MPGGECEYSCNIKRKVKHTKTRSTLDHVQSKMDFILMGEKSKRIGEIGENIVANFFSLIGWDGALPGQSLRCTKPQKHARKEAKSGKRESHGIDYLYCYKSPLESATIESAVISVKHSENPYGSNPKPTFRNHVEDLVQTLECYKHSELKKQQLELFGKVIKNRDSGVLFWLSSNDHTYDDVVSKISNTRLDPEWNFESLHVVDNRRIQLAAAKTECNT